MKGMFLQQMIPCARCRLEQEGCNQFSMGTAKQKSSLSMKFILQLPVCCLDTFLDMREEGKGFRRVVEEGDLSITNVTNEPAEL